MTRARSRQELDDLEERLSEHENRLLQMNNSHETMQRRFLELTELKYVLSETAGFFQEVRFFIPVPALLYFKCMAVCFLIEIDYMF